MDYNSHDAHQNVYCPFSLFASPPSLPYGPCPPIPHNVVILQHSQCPFRNLAIVASLSSNHIGPNHWNLHLLEILIHWPRTLIQTLQFQIQISIIVVRHKSTSHQHFHLLPWRYWPLSTPPSTNHNLIPPNQCIICKFNYYQFHFLRLQIVMAIKNPIHLFLPLQICLDSFLPWKGGIFSFIASKSPSKSACPPTLRKFFLWPNCPLVLFPKSLRFLGYRKPSRWPTTSSSKPLSPISSTASSKSS